MRFFALLFALYFAMLGCLPCTDEVPSAGTQTAYLAAGPGTQGQPGEMDWCSPLCQCHCCSGVLLLPGRPVTFAAGPPAIVWVPSTYAPAGAAALPVRPLATPWQPPQGA